MGKEKKTDGQEKKDLTIVNDYTPVTYDPQYILMVNQLKKYFPIKGGMVSKTVGYVKAVDGITFNLKRGSTMGLVGESGCGKSTLAGLLAGRLEGYAGSITVGGQPLSEISLESRMKQITTVGFAARLFKGTVAENLRMAKPDASDEALWQALEQVNLADFLRSEQGLDTPVAEKGANFSGGQCQRLALARALLHDSPIYILDEATSNIDVESENQIMALVHRLAETKAVLIISHRLANVTGAKRIYALEEGRVAGCGTHAQLLAACPCYQRLWNSQQALEHYTPDTQQEALA